MKTFLLYLFQVFFCSGILLALYRLLLVRKVSYGICRAYLVTALLLAAVIPALDIPLYPAPAPAPALPPVAAASAAHGPEWTEQAVFAEPSGTGPEAVSAKEFLFRGVVWLYGGVVLLSLGIFAKQIVRIRRLRRRSRLTPCDGYTLAEHPQIVMPFSFLRTIFMGESFQGLRREMVLRHEASHVRHCHSVERIVVELIRCLFWFNPFAAIAGRWLAEVQEWEADGDVLDAGYDLKAYRTVIFHQLFGYNPDITCGLNHSFTKNRFIMMTRSNVRRFACLRLGAAIPVVAGMMMLCSFSTRAADPAEPPVSASARPVPDLSGLQPVRVLTSQVSVNLGEASGKPQFGEFAYIPADDAKLRLDGSKITDTKGTDITWWAWKHYGVRAVNPMFLLGGELLTKEEFVAREADRISRKARLAVAQETVYAGAELRQLLGDDMVDALIVWKLESAPVSRVRITRDGIYVNGERRSVEELTEFVAAEREKLNEEERGKWTVVLRADEHVQMGAVEDAKRELHRIKALRLRYESAAYPATVRLLPPPLQQDGPVKVVAPKIKDRNLFQILINGKGQLLAGQHGRQRIVEPEELVALVRDFVVNEGDKADMPEKTVKEFECADGSKMSYPVSEGVVSILVTRDAPFDRYVQVQHLLNDAFEAVRAEAAQRWLGLPYDRLSETDRRLVLQAVPIKVYEAEAAS